METIYIFSYAVILKQHTKYLIYWTNAFTHGTLLLSLINVVLLDLYS